MRSTRLFLITLFVLLATISGKAQDEFTPIATWPFLYKDFTNSKIYVGENNKVVSARANIHVKDNQLWFVSGKDNKTLLEAKSGTVNKVVMSNGDTYYAVNGKMAKVIREDSVAGKLYRVFQVVRLDKKSYDAMVAQSHQGIVDASILGSGFSNFTSSVADNNALIDSEREPLPTVNAFFFLINGETFEVKESQILEHLESKEERRAFRSFVRSAEILFSSQKSVMDIYTTFFLK